MADTVNSVPRPPDERVARGPVTLRRISTTGRQPCIIIPKSFMRALKWHRTDQVIVGIEDGALVARKWEASSPRRKGRE